MDAAGLSDRLPQPGGPGGGAYQPALPRRAGGAAHRRAENPGLSGAGAAGRAGPARQPGYDSDDPGDLRVERGRPHPDRYRRVRAGLPALRRGLADAGGAAGAVHERPGPLPGRLFVQGHGGELGQPPGPLLPLHVRPSGPDHRGDAVRPGALGGRDPCVRPGHPDRRL